MPMTPTRTATGGLRGPAEAVLALAAAGAVPGLAAAGALLGVAGTSRVAAGAAAAGAGVGEGLVVLAGGAPVQPSRAHRATSSKPSRWVGRGDQESRETCSIRGLRV